MLQLVSHRVACFLFHLGCITKEEIAWCVFSLQKRILTGFAIVLILFLGKYICGFIPALMYLLCVLPLRTQFGGYHTSTPWTCIILSLCVSASALVIASRIPVNWSIQVSVLNCVVTLFLTLTVVKSKVCSGEGETYEQQKENYRIGLLIIEFIEVTSVLITLTLQAVPKIYIHVCQLGAVTAVISALIRPKQKEDN